MRNYYAIMYGLQQSSALISMHMCTSELHMFFEYLNQVVILCSTVPNITQEKIDNNLQMMTTIFDKFQ